MILSARDKRRFLNMAFYPSGSDVVQTVHLFPQSPEVAEAEDAAVRVEHDRLFSGSRLDDLIKLADWYSDAVDAIEVAGLPIAQRTLDEHLVSFVLAVRTMTESVSG